MPSCYCRTDFHDLQRTFKEHDLLYQMNGYTIGTTIQYSEPIVEISVEWEGIPAIHIQSTTSFKGDTSVVILIVLSLGV